MVPLDAVVSEDKLPEVATFGDVNPEQLRAVGGTSVVAFSDGAVGLSKPVPYEDQFNPQVSIGKGRPFSEDLAELKRISKSGLVRYTPEAVIGSDDRRRATPTNTYPRRAVVQITTADGASCSGVLYASNEVMTAAHCLYDVSASPRRWRPYPWTVEPARDGSTHNATACTSITGGFVLSSYQTDPKAENDFGALKLGCSYPGSIGNGYYPIVALPLTAASSFKDGLFVMGYPAVAKGNPVLGQHWEHTGRLIWEYSTLKTLNVDTSPGQSGGPWAVPCTEYGWYYCTVGPHSGSAAFLVGGMNIGHQVSPAELGYLDNL